MGTLPMHSGYILKDYSKKVKRTAAFRNAAGARKSGKAPPLSRRGFAVLIWFQARRSVCMTFFMRPEPSLLSK